MAALGKRGEGVRLKVRMFPTEIVVNSAIKTITIEPFWMMVFSAECHSIHDVKNKILSKLNMGANKIKVFANKSKNCGDLNMSMDSDNEAEISENTDYHCPKKTASDNKKTTITNHITTDHLAAFTNEQIISVTPHPVTAKSMTKSIRFESCRLSIDNFVLPSSERSDILKDEDLVSVKVTSCKLCEPESFEFDRHQQKIFKSRKCLSSSNEILHKVNNSDDNSFFRKTAANCDSISLDTNQSSETRSQTKSKKRKRTLSHETDQLLINLEEETGNKEKKGASESANVIEKPPGKTRKRSKKRNKKKPSSEDPVLKDNLDLDKDAVHLDQESASFQVNGSTNTTEVFKGVMAEYENGDIRINSKVTDEPNVSEMEMENAVETVNLSRDLPDSVMDVSGCLEQLLKKKAEELTSRTIKPTGESFPETTAEPQKRKRNRKRKKKGTSAASALPLETAVSQSDYSLRLPPHLMPQNSRLTFEREDENIVSESNINGGLIVNPVTTTEHKNSESSEEIQVHKRILKPLHSKPAENNTLSGYNNSQINVQKLNSENIETENSSLPHNSGDQNFHNSVGHLPKKPGLSDANLRRATISFIDRAQVTPNNNLHNTSSTSTLLGTPIDPADKFQQLLRQRSFSGRQLEISKSVAGHSLCVSHRKKRDLSFNAGLSSAADPDTDVVTNISTIQQSNLIQATSVHPSPAKRQDTELGQPTDSRNPAVPQTSHNQSCMSVDVNEEKTRGLPKAGDILVFKVLELSEDYTPTMSEFKEAKVLHVDSESNSVQVELKGEKFRQRRQGRFELYYGENEEENGEDEQDTIVTYGLSELLEMQVISGADHCRPRH